VEERPQAVQVGRAGFEPVPRAALDPLEGHTAVADDLGGLRRPRRDRARPRRDQQAGGFGLEALTATGDAQHRSQTTLDFRRGRRRESRHIEVLGLDSLDIGHQAAATLEQGGAPEVRQGRRAVEEQQGHPWSHGGTWGET
jgi:hypothetical protein